MFTKYQILNLHCEYIEHIKSIPFIWSISLRVLVVLQILTVLEV